MSDSSAQGTSRIPRGWMCQTPIPAHDRDMDSASITESLASIFSPIVLASGATLALALLTGVVARLVELTDQN